MKYLIFAENQACCLKLFGEPMAIESIWPKFSMTRPDFITMPQSLLGLTKEISNVGLNALLNPQLRGFSYPPPSPNKKRYLVSNKTLLSIYFEKPYRENLNRKKRTIGIWLSRNFYSFKTSVC